MARKDISDKEAIEAVIDSIQFRKEGRNSWPHLVLIERTGLSEEDCFNALQRIKERGFIIGESMLLVVWPTPEGVYYLKTNDVLNVEQNSPS